MNKRVMRFPTLVLALLVLASTAPDISAQEEHQHASLEVPEDVRFGVAGLSSLDNLNVRILQVLDGQNDAVTNYYERNLQFLADSLIDESMILSEPQFHSWQLARGGMSSRRNSHMSLIRMWKMTDFTRPSYQPMIDAVEIYAEEAELHAHYFLHALEGFPMADTFVEPLMIESALYLRVKELLEEMRSR